MYNSPPFVKPRERQHVTGLPGNRKKTMSGNNVSHANNKSKRRFLPNLHVRRFWVESENRWVKLRVSTRGLRTIDKLGIDQVLADVRSRGIKV